MKHSEVNRKFSLITSLAVHSLNLYSLPFSNLYTFSNFVVFLQPYSIRHIANW